MIKKLMEADFRSRGIDIPGLALETFLKLIDGNDDFFGLEATDLVVDQLGLEGQESEEVISAIKTYAFKLINDLIEENPGIPASEITDQED